MASKQVIQEIKAQENQLNDTDYTANLTGDLSDQNGTPQVAIEEPFEKNSHVSLVSHFLKTQAFKFKD